MFYYKISFNKGDDGLVANDAFNALRGEYYLEDRGDGWWVEDKKASFGFKNVGAYLYVASFAKVYHYADGNRPANDNAKFIAQDIADHYKEYEPTVEEVYEEDEVEESYNPTSRAAAFRAMKKGGLELHKLSEAFTVLKKAGATIKEAYDAVTAHRKANGDTTYSGKFTTRLRDYLNENGIKAKFKPDTTRAIELNDGDYSIEFIWSNDESRNIEGSKGDRAAYDNNEYSLHENKVGLQFFVANDLDATESREFDIRNLPSMLKWIEDCMERYDSENENSDVIDIMSRLQQMFDADYGGSKALKGYRVEGGGVDDEGVGSIHISKSLKRSSYEIEVQVSKSKRGYEIGINWENVDTEEKDTEFWTENDVRDAAYNIGAFIRNELK